MRARAATPSPTITRTWAAWLKASPAPPSCRSGHSLGYILITLGTCLLLGIKNRTTLFLTGLVYVGLSFGLMAVQESDGVAWLGMHIVMFGFALVLVRNNRFELWADKRD